MNISEQMKHHAIDRVVLVTDDEGNFRAFHAWCLEMGGLDHFMGRGPTVEEAIHDCVQRCQREAA